MSDLVARVASPHHVASSGSTGSVIPFPRRASTRRAETTALLDAVSAAGSIDIAPRAFAAREAAAALHLMGLVDLHEILPDGRKRALKASEARSAWPCRTWRVSARLARMPAG